MSNNEITREIYFEVKAKYFKENVTEYFSKYKNDSGAEDCIEICLIREGYRAVLSAEEEINRQKAEIEELQELVNEMSDYFPACIGCEGKTTLGERTDKCVYEIDNTNYCTKRGITNIVAIQKENRELKAEIERLKRKLVAYEPSVDSGLFSQMLLEQKEKAEAFEKKWKAEIKSEAYREFAERSEKELFVKQNEHREHWMETLNQHKCTKAYKDYEWSIDNWLRGYGEAVQDILAINQNFLKELVGDDDG